MHACAGVLCYEYTHILIPVSCKGIRSSNLGEHEFSDGEVSSDGQVVEEFNLHGVCCFFACCNLSVSISFTIDAVNNVSFNRDCPTIIFTADSIVLLVVVFI